MALSNETTQKSKKDLSMLLHHLDAEIDNEVHTWKDWVIQPIAGGANNRLFRVKSAADDLVVKFTIRDERDRAGREFAALLALQQTSYAVTPEAVWLDRHSFNQPVIVQTWLEGEALNSPPKNLQEWQALADHYLAIHQLTPEKTAVKILPAVLNAASGTDGKGLVRRHLERIPAQFRPTGLVSLVKRFEAWAPPQWAPPRLALCRVDANWRNFIRIRNAWGSVDWENSGWGDPAFEIADLITHPAYIDAENPPWEWVISHYCDRIEDEGARLRIQTYIIILLVWWVVRWQRYLYEVPRGLDARLVDRPETWMETVDQNYRHYLNLAESCIP